MIPALRRLPEAPGLVEQEGYFVVHAPRQTGKTTALRALAEELTAKGDYAALHFSCEVGEAAEDQTAAQLGILEEIRRRAGIALPPEHGPPPWPTVSGGNLLAPALTAWAQACPRPLVLFFDEIDALVGRSRTSVLHQLRAGFNDRPAGFPASVALCGLRSVRDYKAASGGDPARLGSASPFNIVLKSLRLGDFSPAEVRELYGQYTADTGQEFTGDAVDRVLDYTRGQPWLVNALAREIVEEMAVPVSRPVTVAHVDEAKERLILARATHLDSLAARLVEPRVRRVIEPVITGEITADDDFDTTYDDDVAYLIDLGLLAPVKEPTVANPIYREVIVRVLGASTERVIVADPRAFVQPDGRLDFSLVLHEFAGFWRQHADVLVHGGAYHEAAAQLVFMAYLHRVINGGGHIDREYGVGRGRIDLAIRWPYLDLAGKRRWQREAIELKVWRTRKGDPTAEGLRQLDAYLARLDLDHGTLVVFDQRRDAPSPAERTHLTDTHTPSGRPVTFLHA